MMSPEETIYEAIKAYGRTNDDEVWRKKEADIVAQALRAQGLLIQHHSPLLPPGRMEFEPFPREGQ